MELTKLRTGIGYDVHSLIPGNNIVIGGVKIAHYKSIKAHSDGDVLTHSIIDGILGAAGLGDIGTHFPDSDENYKNISSILLLKEIYKKIKNTNFKIINIDTIIIAEAPKFKYYITEMKKNICSAIELQSEVLNIKATTTEKQDSFGRENAIGAQSIILGYYDD